ncbi:pyrimidine 5'-nucleotidase [Salaquimonas pukyongi]|uniref:pyrimidine 5'-nucleotidase n=1 Tax=Salaquimonas pukyongi TaxID=2712698 RepID=UPI00096B6C44|nr:pyrimidine 5'-nucleotidase [Salaquimonas pukyongi]
MKDAFSNITEWVFDLDNTLYPRHTDLFKQIDWKMTDYVASLTGLAKDEARKLQKQLYRDHGTTLNGLMMEYSIDPHDYLAHVHDIDYGEVEANPALGELIASLPGRKHIFTNGDVRHAENTLRAIGIEPVFDSMFDIVAADFEPKPARGPYEKFLKAHVVHPVEAVMFEDMPRNLEVPKDLGMVTVLIVPRSGSTHSAEQWELAGGDAPHIDHVTDHLDDFLADVLEAIGPARNPA